MFDILLVISISGVLIGLCFSQKDATDREMQFRIKYHDLFLGLYK
jgi:hypothetical protein